MKEYVLKRFLICFAGILLGNRGCGTVLSGGKGLNQAHAHY